MAMDEWIDDENVLREITQSEDYIGEWWDVPIEHLLQCLMGLSYLDAAGMEFYLPAYMKVIVEKPEVFDEAGITSRSWAIAYTMLPDDEDQEMAQYFQERFSKIREGKKHVCREFLQYLANCMTYDEHTRQIAKEALGHKYWSDNLLTPVPET